ncbi:MAG: septum site-determining protein MinD [Lachnospiraceae bacterium]|nr:septum site-determining protein MinD [Lachnospiraceae bacterium]
MSRVIVVASGKGGVGKTTIAAGLGVSLGAAGRKTALIDLDFGLRNIDVTLGMETSVLNHFGDYLKGELPLEEVLTQDERYPNLALLAAPQNASQEDLTEEAMTRLIEELRQEYEVILIDSPAGVGPVFSQAIRQADEGIVVTGPVISAVRDADKVLHLMEAAGVTRRFVIVNMLRRRLMKNHVMMSPEDIQEVLGADLLGVVPEDEAVIICCNAGKPLGEGKSPADRALRRIAQRVRGTVVALPPLNGRRGGLFRGGKGAL